MARLSTIVGVVVLVVGVVLLVVAANTLVNLVRDPSARDRAFPKTFTVTQSGPNASFTWVSNGYNVTFTDTSTDNGGVLVAWVWDFGDGSAPYEGANPPTHTYAVACPMCTESVALAVNDSAGRQSVATANVTVQARGSSSGSASSPLTHIPSLGPLSSGLPELVELSVLMVVISYSTLRAARELLRRPWEDVAVPIATGPSPPGPA